MGEQWESEMKMKMHALSHDRRQSAELEDVTCDEEERV